MGLLYFSLIIKEALSIEFIISRVFTFTLVVHLGGIADS